MNFDRLLAVILVQDLKATWLGNSNAQGGECWLETESEGGQSICSREFPAIQSTLEEL